jgi:hypothetical protein
MVIERKIGDVFEISATVKLRVIADNNEFCKGCYYLYDNACEREFADIMVSGKCDGATRCDGTSAKFVIF